MEDLSHFETSDAYNELQKDVLRYAEQVTSDIQADDTIVAQLRQRLSDQELVKLTMTISLANLTNRIAEALKLELP